jgi:protein subunit release factor A
VLLVSGLVGTHRVQRVPATEKQGRRHSSTVTVIEVSAVEDSARAVERREVRLTTFKAPGAGGQHRNKTDSAVRLRHLPTGVVVTATEDRSQYRNREVAWRRLADAVEAEHRRNVLASANIQRAGQFGSAQSWTWCGWRDEVTSPSGQRASMRRALSGELVRLVE